MNMVVNKKAMTQEEKQLLLIDLCGRLPYGVKLVHPNKSYRRTTNCNTSVEILVDEGWLPCLRPMSSMTSEEKEEYSKTSGVNSLDWLLKNHFDCRGLIEKKLAYEES